MAKKEAAEETAPVFTKQQFLASNRFTPHQRDVLTALLKDGESYTNGQVDKILQDFFKKEVR